MLALVIDDSRAMRMILRRSLAACGFQVVDAANGRLALEVLAAGPLPDVALVDWNMPVMDGLQFVTAVREVPAYRPLVLMMVTTDSEHAQIGRALAAGVDEYLLKPFTAEAVADKLSLLGLRPAA